MQDTIPPPGPTGASQPIDNALAAGMRHLADANATLLRQRRLVWRLAAKGEPTADAERVLADMIQALRIMRERLSILEVAGDAAKSPLALGAEKPMMQSLADLKRAIASR